MPANTSAADRLGMGTHPATRLVSVSGARDMATPRDVERQAAAGGFFWLDLESLDGELLGQFGRSLRLGTSAIAGMAMGTERARQRPSLTADGTSSKRWYQPRAAWLQTRRLSRSGSCTRRSSC
jgi:hypothetical protein